MRSVVDQDNGFLVIHGFKGMTLTWVFTYLNWGIVEFVRD